MIIENISNVESETLLFYENYKLILNVLTQSIFRKLAWVNKRLKKKVVLKTEIEETATTKYIYWQQVSSMIGYEKHTLERQSILK